MAAHHLKHILSFEERRGPNGHIYGEAQRNGRTFRLCRQRDGWLLSELIIEASVEPARTRPPARPPRSVPRRVRRELAALGLVEAGEEMRSAS